MEIYTTGRMVKRIQDSNSKLGRIENSLFAICNSRETGTDKYSPVGQGNRAENWHFLQLRDVVPQAVSNSRSFPGAKRSCRTGNAIVRVLAMKPYDNKNHFISISLVKLNH